MATTNADRVSYRPVRLVGVLLVFEAVGLASLAAYHVYLRAGWPRMELVAELRRSFETLAAGGAFVAAAILAAVGAMGFLFMRRRGWLPAALAQTLGLGTCVALYADLEPAFVYPVMGYCIVMVLYLNSRDVRTVFHPGREPGDDTGGGA
ncbi:MAG TPA: hypothetical protein VKA51_00200 [Rubrobacteraceae bacterium]|nr:hypothetical protein [Rubrobacteraceae bacterium]